MQANQASRTECVESAPDTVELTILMPCLNERATVATCVAAARQFLTLSGVNGEIVVADNGSTDGSQFIANSAGARVVEVFERGYGAALATGIRIARGRYIIMGDSDASYDFTDLNGIMAELRAGRDLVVGDRFKGGIEPGAMPFLHRFLGNPVLSFLGRLLFSIPVSDFHCGLRGFSADAIRSLKLSASGMEFASEMIVKAGLAGLSISETPIALSRDGRNGPSHLRTWQDGWRHVRFLFVHSPRWLFGYPGLLSLAAGLFGVAWLSTNLSSVETAGTAHLLSVVACGFAILLGANLVVLGALARRSASLIGILPVRTRLHRALASISLEAMLGAAITIAILGGVGVVWFALTSDNSAPIVSLTVSMTATTVALQSGAAAFFETVVTARAGR